MNQSPTLTAANNRLAPYLGFMYCPSAQSADTNLPVTTYVANGGYLGAPPSSSGGTSEAAVIASDIRPGNGVFVNRSTLEWAALANCASITAPALPKVGMSDITDGASSTMLFSENMNVSTASPFRFWTLSGKVYGGQAATILGGGTCPDIRHELGYNVMGFVYASEVPQVQPPLNPPNPAAGGPASQMLINGEKDEVFIQDVTTMRPSSNHPGGVNASFADGHTAFINEAIPYYVYQQLLTARAITSNMPFNDHTLQGGELQ